MKSKDRQKGNWTISDTQEKTNCNLTRWMGKNWSARNKFAKEKKKPKTTKTWLKMVGNEWKGVKIEGNKNVMA